MAASKEPQDKLNSLDEAISRTVEELRAIADAELVADAEREVISQLADEVRQRLAQAVKAKAEARKAATAKPGEEEEFERFSLTFRIQHICLFTSCIILIVTGIPLKFPDSRWAETFFNMMGGVLASGVIHRVGATLLIAVGIAHMGYILLTREGRREFIQLLPRLKDVKDVITNMRYFLSLSKQGARFGRFSYVEKFDYWAVYWGTVVMITSGILLWFQNLAMKTLPKFVLDMAHEAHSDEALLATLAIIVWHFYNVHFSPDNFPMSKLWLTGKISKSNMMRHHPLEYDEIMEKSQAAENNGKKPHAADSQSSDRSKET